jgi:hypothetical protein
VSDALVRRQRRHRARNFLHATACGKALARAHARTGDPIAIAAYIGKGRRFDAALGEFAVDYAEQNARDHRELSDAVANGAIEGHE